MWNQCEMWELQINGISYPVQVTYKNMRTVRLRVAAGGEIRLSAPFGTDPVWLDRFLTQRSDWIVRTVEKMKHQAAAEKLPPLTDAERKKALAYLQPMVDRWYPAVEPYGVPRPHVTVRAMRTRYGSCSVGRGRITLSSVLLQVPEECAEYVVLHELAHFVHPNHSRQFYEFIAGYMPDWKKREKLLFSPQPGIGV